MAAGLDSFKIEGRTKSVYYLSQVVRAYRMAIDSCAAQMEQGIATESVKVSDESRRAISFVDGRGFMPGFLRGPLPQNYESTHEEAPGGCVAAQVIAYDPNTKACRVNVKNPFSIEDSLELMTPSGMAPCKIDSMKDFKGGDVDRLHPGTEGWIFFSEDVKGLQENATFCFFVRNIT
jgi:putative protease